jgi:hypothetical protein
MQAAVRTRGLGWSMFWALVSYLVTTIGTMLANYLTPADVTPLQGSLISTAVGLMVVMIGVLIDRAKSGRPQELPPPAATYPGVPAARPGSRPGTMSWVLVIFVVLLLCGCGGAGVTYAAQWIGSRVVTDIECMQHPDRCVEEGPSVSRLAQPVSKSAGYVKVTVTKVAVAEKNVLVTITVRNGGPKEITMPSIQLTIPGARTLQRDSLAGDWAQGNVPAQGERTGLLFFNGVIAGDVTSVTLAFTQIFSLDFNAPENMSIDIPLITTS